MLCAQCRTRHVTPPWVCSGCACLELRQENEHLRAALERIAALDHSADVPAAAIATAALLGRAK